MNIYVVCMDSSWVRDSQMFDLVGLPDSELTELDVCGTENEGRWHDMEPTPFIAIIKAETENEACMKAAVEHRYEPRIGYRPSCNAGGFPAADSRNHTAGCHPAG